MLPDWLKGYVWVVMNFNLTPEEQEIEDHAEEFEIVKSFEKSWLRCVIYFGDWPEIGIESPASLALREIAGGQSAEDSVHRALVMLVGIRGGRRGTGTSDHLVSVSLLSKR